MTPEIIFVMAVLVISFGMFVSGRLRPDLVAMLVLATLVLSQVIEPAQAFAGFSSFAVITIAGLMVIGEGLKKTGVVKWTAQQLARGINQRYSRLLLINTAVPGVLSGFVNIVAAASFFIPIVLRLSKQLKVPQAKILLPMACTALLGANLSLIGASHNLVVDSLLKDATGESFGFFEFTSVGAALLVAALLYTFFIGQHLLPGARKTPDPIDAPVTIDLDDVYGLEDRLFEVWVSSAGEGIAPKVERLELDKWGLTLIALVRAGEQLVLPHPDMALEEGDMLLLLGREEVVEGLAELDEALTYIGPPKAQVAYPISTAELAEAVVPPRSAAVGKKVRDLDLPGQFGMTAIAYYRDGTPHRTAVRDEVLQEGDSLLVYGPREKMREFNPEKELLIYFKPGEPEVSSRLKRRAPYAAAILLAVIAVAALGWMPIAATAVLGAVAMVVLGIVRLDEVYSVIDWRTLILVGGMFPLGVALNTTGAADAIGEGLIAAVGDLGPLAVLAGISVLCIALTQPIHNAAVAIIMTPIAINVATLMQSNPKAFAVTVIVSCSAAFLMPYGHPAPFLVQEPGGYRSRDYLRFGSGLTVLTFAIILGLVPLLWPL